MTSNPNTICSLPLLGRDKGWWSRRPNSLFQPDFERSTDPHPNPPHKGEGGPRKTFSLVNLVCVFLVIGAVIMLGKSSWIMLKAEVSQVLLHRAFAQSIATGEKVKAWAWADTYPVAEVRIPRARLDALVQMLAARSSLSPHDPIVARALSVRLRTSESIFIELATPETQWLEHGAHAVHDEALVWRWNLTPKDTGKTRLTLLVSMRSASLDGIGEEVALPDRYIDVKVRGRRIRKFLRFVGFMSLLALAAVLGRIGGELGPMLVRSLRSVAGL